MTKTMRETDIAPDGPAPTRTRGRPASGPRRWWQRPWIAPLMVVTVVFLVYSLPPYLTFDPSQSRVPVREGFLLHYPLLVAHILFGSVALLAGCMQVWPWFRQRYPAAHRMMGRVYLFGGVFPAGVAVLGVAPFSSTGFVSQVGNTMLAVLWLPISVAGYRMARQRRFAEHRKWMIRSFALTTSIVVNRLWVILMIVVLQPQLNTTYGGDAQAMTYDAASAAVWLSWVVNLLIAEWWIQYGAPAKRRARRAASHAETDAASSSPPSGAGTAPTPRSSTARPARSEIRS